MKKTKTELEVEGPEATSPVDKKVAKPTKSVSKLKEVEANEEHSDVKPLITEPSEDPVEVLTEKVEEMYHMVKNCVTQMDSVKNNFDQKANEKNVSYNFLIQYLYRLLYISIKLEILYRKSAAKSRIRITWRKNPK